MEILLHQTALRWRRLSSGTTNRRIFGATIVVGGATAFVSLTLVTRDLFLAAIYGRSDVLDAFLIAGALPLLIVSVVAGSFAPAVIPTFIRLREHEGQAAAQQLYSGALSLGIGLLIAISVLLALASSIVLPLLGSRFEPEKLALTQQLFFLLLPTTFLAGLAIMWSAALNAGERFALAALTPALVPVAAIFGLLLGRSWGIHALIFGMYVGYVLQLCFLGRGLARQNVSLWPHWQGLSPALRQSVAHYVPLMVSVTLTGGALIVSQAVAASLDPGSVAALTYGSKVVQLVIGLGTVAVATAVLPFFSKAIAMGNWDQIRQTVQQYAWLILLATISTTVAIVVFSEPIVAVLFQRGAFTGADTALVARVQAFYALQIPFYVLSALCGSLLASLGANREILRITAISFLLNAVFALVLVGVMGVAGIALATALAQLVAFCLFAITLRKTSVFAH